jgi:hypothetical protein
VKTREQYDAAVAAMRELGVGNMLVDDFTVPDAAPYRYAQLHVRAASDDTILRMVRVAVDHGLHVNVWGDRHTTIAVSRNLDEDEIKRAPVGHQDVA